MGGGESLAPNQYVDLAMLRLRIMELSPQGQIKLVGMSFLANQTSSVEGKIPAEASAED